MSWLINHFSERYSQTSNLSAELRLATKEETEEEMVKQGRCNLCAIFNKVVNFILVPSIFKLRHVEDCLTRTSPDFDYVEMASQNEFVTRNTIVMKEVLKWHRRDLSEAGLFSHSRLSNLIANVSNQIFSPGGLSPIQISDNMMICDKIEHEKYRKFLDQFFSQISIRDHIESIETIVDKTLTKLENKGNVVINDKVKVLAITVMANIFLGLDDFFDTISLATSNIVPWITDEGAMAQSSVYNFLVYLFPGKKFISDEGKRVTGTVLSEAITQAIKNAKSDVNSKTIVAEMLREGFSVAQIQSMILTLFIAGQDNVATTITHSLLKLAQDVEMQNRIRENMDEPLKSTHIIALLSESLRTFCPIGGLGRVVGEKDLVMTLKDKKTDEVFSKTFIQKGAGVNATPIFAAKDPSLFPSPSEFDVDRFKGAKSLLAGLKHMPFGHGPHKCPGWYLFHVIAALTIDRISKNYDTTTSFVGEPKMRTGFVSGVGEDIQISFKKRV